MPSEWLKSRRHQAADHACFPKHHCDINVVQSFGATPSLMNACFGQCSVLSMYLRHRLRLQYVEQLPCALSRGNCTPQVLNAALVSTAADEEASLAPLTGAVTGLQKFAAKSQQLGLPLILRGRCRGAFFDFVPRSTRFATVERGRIRSASHLHQKTLCSWRDRVDCAGRAWKCGRLEIC